MISSHDEVVCVVSSWLVHQLNSHFRPAIIQCSAIGHPLRPVLVGKILSYLNVLLPLNWVCCSIDSKQIYSNRWMLRRAIYWISSQSFRHPTAIFFSEYSQQCQQQPERAVVCVRNDFGLSTMSLYAPPSISSINNKNVSLRAWNTNSEKKNWEESANKQSLPEHSIRRIPITRTSIHTHPHTDTQNGYAG